MNIFLKTMIFTKWLQFCFICFSLCLSIMHVAYAATLTKITNNIIGVGPKNNLVNPYLCIQDESGQVIHKVAPGEAVNYRGASSYMGAVLRFGGCGWGDSYLGYVGFDIKAHKFLQYSPHEGVHVTYLNPAIDAKGHVSGNIVYTPIISHANLLSTPPKVNAYWDFVGINLSGLEFSKMIDPVVIPNLSAEDAQGKYSDLAETRGFLAAGMNTVRVPVRWGYLQLEGPGRGEINLDYYNSYVKPLLETLTAARVYTIVDLHSYMRYSVFGKEYAGCGSGSACPDGTLIKDSKAYQDLWGKLYTLIKNNPKINMDFILLDLVNEPVNVPNDLVFTIQANVIKYLRQQGYQGYILVEGNAWSGLHSWSSATWRSEDGKTQYSNEILFSRENFAKAGIMDLNKILINVHQYLDFDYSGTHDQCQAELPASKDTFVRYLATNKLKAIVTEFGSGRDSASCRLSLEKFLEYLKNNSAKNKEYGFVGWTIWSTGHGWGDYNLRVKLDSYHMQVLKKFL